MALVFQYYSLYPRYTVRQNLEFPLKSAVRNVAPDEIARRIARVSEMLRIGHLLDRKTDRLSGGEMQRVSIGRAIVRDPSVFLMDEPLSNLDAKLREALRSELKNLQTTLGATFLFVTHDQIEAMTMGDKVGVLNEGRLVQVGTPNEIYNAPRDTFVAAFVGSPAMNLLPGRLADGRLVVPGAFDLPLEPAGRTRLGRAADGPLTIGIRSEDVLVGSGPATASVHHVENHGVELVVTLKAGDSLFKATMPAVTRLSIDETLPFSLNQERLHGFDFDQRRQSRPQLTGGRGRAENSHTLSICIPYGIHTQKTMLFQQLGGVWPERAQISRRRRPPRRGRRH